MDATEIDFLRQVRPLYARLDAVARRYCPHPEDAADLVQETLLRAWKAFSPIETPSRPRAWLFAIMRNIVIDWYRSSRRHVDLLPAYEELTEIAAPGMDEPLAPLSAMTEEGFREFLDANIARALQALEAPFREVILLSVAGDLGYREIADVLDCPLGTVMSRMARARRFLRDRLGEFDRAAGRMKECQR